MQTEPTQEMEVLDEQHRKHFVPEHSQPEFVHGAPEHTDYFYERPPHYAYYEPKPPRPQYYYPQY